MLARAIKSGLKLDGLAAVHPSLRFEELGGGNLLQLTIYLQKLPLLMVTSGNDPENLKPFGAIHSHLLEYY